MCFDNMLVLFYSNCHKNRIICQIRLDLFEEYRRHIVTLRMNKIASMRIDNGHWLVGSLESCIRDEAKYRRCLYAFRIKELTLY